MDRLASDVRDLRRGPNDNSSSGVWHWRSPSSSEMAAAPMLLPEVSVLLAHRSACLRPCISICHFICTISASRSLSFKLLFSRCSSSLGGCCVSCAFSLSKKSWLMRLNSPIKATCVVTALSSTPPPHVLGVCPEATEAGLSGVSSCFSLPDGVGIGDTALVALGSGGTSARVVLPAISILAMSAFALSNLVFTDS